MIRVLQAFSVSVLLCAGFVLVRCVVQLQQEIPRAAGDSEFSIVERFKQYRAQDVNASQEAVHPLVEKAKAFAGHLGAPGPPKSRGIRRPTSTRKQMASPARPVQTTPKFTLIATSYYYAKPEESLALVSEPDGGSRWVKKGARLGHLVVEKVEPETIIYWDGGQIAEMTVGASASVRTAQCDQELLALSNAGMPTSNSVSHRAPKATIRSQVYKFGSRQAEAQSMVDDY